MSYDPNTNWTPGPWSLSDEVERDGLLSRQVYGAPEGMLAIVRTANQGRHYGAANANLIAAAPDLYEALEALMGDATFKLAKKGGNLEEIMAHTSQARTALAKARGEAPTG